MKQFLAVALLCGALAVAAADKRPFQFQRGQAFSFQRQTDAGAGAPETEGLSPPAPGAPAAPACCGGQGSGSDAGGPYPPSGQPESGPYPPSGWKPQGQRLELPARQQKPPQNTYGAPPKQPQQQYGAPPKQPQQQYGAPPKQPQQQYGAPPKQPQQPEASEAEAPAAEPATESPDVVASNRLRNQVRQQRVILQRMRQLVRDQQAQLQQQRHEQQALLEQLQQLQQLRGVDVQQQQQGGEAAQGQYVVNLPDGRVQRVQYANTPSSVSVFKQNVQQPGGVQVQAQPEQSQNPPSFTSPNPPTYVARLQFMDVPPIDAPVFSYSGSAPLVRVA